MHAMNNGEILDSIVKLFELFSQNIESVFHLNNSNTQKIFLFMLFNDPEWLETEDIMNVLNCIDTNRRVIEIRDSKNNKKYAEFCKTRLDFFHSRK